jgi:hypothetical protein
MGSGSRPDAILLAPLISASDHNRACPSRRSSGGGGYGMWVVLNRDADYLGGLRSHSSAPVFCRRHGSVHPGARQQLCRWATNGRHGEHKAGQYSPQSAPEQSARRERMPGGNRWLRLSTNRASSIDAVGSKYDGSRRPPEEQAARLPAGRSGVDDLAEEGKAWVEQGSLVATVVS